MLCNAASSQCFASEPNIQKKCYVEIKNKSITILDFILYAGFLGAENSCTTA